MLTRLKYAKYRNRGFSSDCCSKIPHHRYQKTVLKRSHGILERSTGSGVARGGGGGGEMNSFLTSLVSFPFTHSELKG